MRQQQQQQQQQQQYTHTHGDIAEAIQTAEIKIWDALHNMRHYVEHIQAYIEHPHPGAEKRPTQAKGHDVVARYITSFQLKKMAHLFDDLHECIMHYHRIADHALNPYQGIEYRRLSALVVLHPSQLSRAEERKRLLALTQQFKRYWDVVDARKL